MIVGRRGLNLIPACLSNHMHSKVWDEIIIADPFQVALVKFGNGQLISFHTLWLMQLLTHVKIKVNLCQ